MNAIRFDDTNKSAEITVQELARTMELGNSNGEMPQAIPMQPGVLLETITEKIQRLSGLQAITKPIVIREQYCQTDRKVLKEGGSLKLEHYLIKRFVTKIELPKLEFKGTAKEMCPAVAVTYAYTDSAKGIQVAFGENVSVCENLCAFGRYHFSTFGNSKVSFAEGMQLLDHWLMNAMVIHKTHIDVVKKLEARKVSRKEYIGLIGNLFQSSVRNNSGYKVFAPLNQSQVAAMVNHSGEFLIDGNEGMTAWDILNAGTNVLKPHTSDMIQLLEDTTGFNDFLLAEMNIPMAEPAYKAIDKVPG